MTVTALFTAMNEAEAAWKAAPEGLDGLDISLPALHANEAAEREIGRAHV